MRGPAFETRRKLIRTAERLFAERGIDAVSLVEIGRAADQRNRNATQYHFGDKRGLLAAILEKHGTSIALARHRLLDALEAGPEPPTLRGAVRALVLPVAAKLADEDGGRDFLLINAQLLGHATFELTGQLAAGGITGHDRLMRAMIPLVKTPAAERAPRQMLVTTLLVRGLADYVRAGKAAPPRELFVDCLVDSIARILGSDSEPD